MSRFRYRAKDQSGKISQGAVEARSEKDASNLLHEQGLLVIDLKPASGAFSIRTIISAIEGVGFSEIVNFTRQLSTMIIAGLTLTDAISIILEQTQNKKMAKMLEEVLHEIEAGNNFASALSKYPNYFSKTYVASIRAGESAGMLDQVLSRLADNLEKEREFRSKVKGAMIYPTIIIVGMGVVLFLMMTLVVPRLVAMYKDFGSALPFATRALMVISDFFVNFWWVIIVSTIGSVYFFLKWRKSEVGARMFDSFVFSIPIIGTLNKQIILTDFCRTLGLLAGAGLPIIEALHIVSGAVGNVTFEDSIEEIALKVEKGFPLGTLLSRSELYPPILGQMTKVGEETGKLDESLIKLSKYFETESELTVKSLTTAIEPMILVVLGVGVGLLVWAVIMPMYQLVSSIQ